MAIKHNVEKKGQYTNEFVYILNATLYYASILSPKEKYKDPANKEYALTAFFSSEDRAKMEDHTDDDGLFINKQFFEVGKDKNKNKKIKFPAKEGELYEPVKGLHGGQFTLPAKSKKGQDMKLTVVDSKGKPWPKDKLIGNGSKAHIKLFGYRNQEGQLNVTLNTIVITEHVEYTDNGGGEVVDDILGISYSREFADANSDDNGVMDEFDEAPSAVSDQFVPEEDEDDY